MPRPISRSINDPSYWRARANELRAVAAQATDPKVKATSFGAADAYDKLAQVEKASPASELPEATPQPVDVEQEGTLLSGLSVRDFPVADALNNLANCKGNDQPPLALTAGPAMTGDGDHERLETLIYGLQRQHQACRLPRATQLAPIPDLPPVDSYRALPTRVLVDLHKRMPTPTLLGPGRTFLDRTTFLVAGAMIVAGVGFFVAFVATIWPPEMDFAVAPIAVPSETRLATRSPLPLLPPMQLNGRTAESGSSEQESKLTMSSEDKLTKSGIEVSPPQALPATEYRTKGDTSAMPGSNSVHQASPRSSADAALEALGSEPPRKGRFAARVHDSTCFPSAFAVRQENPTAWPSWTLRAPGHEGTKCWYAATRATVRDH